MGEWLKPADCKSAPPCEVRRFESFPVHQIEVFCWRENPAKGTKGSEQQKPRALFARDLRHSELVVTKRLVLALAAYVALAALVLTTINDPKIRAATLVVLAMFAVKTWIRRGDVLHPDGESGSDIKPM